MSREARWPDTIPPAVRCCRCGRAAPETRHIIPSARLCRRCLGQEEGQ